MTRPSLARFGLVGPLMRTRLLPVALVGLVLAGCAMPDLTALDTTATPASGPSAASTALDALPVKGRAPKTGYDREKDFGADWSVDTDHNRCDARNDVLRRDLMAVTLKADGCVVTYGLLVDPYTGKNITFTRGVDTSRAVQIDHVVALGDAWQKGAQVLDQATREQLANDPLELIAVDGPSNEAKRDSDAASWLPPNKWARCSYVARQIAVKAKYQLWVTPAERTAMADVLAPCPHQALPTGASRG